MAFKPSNQSLLLLSGLVLLVSYLLGVDEALRAWISPQSENGPIVKLDQGVIRGTFVDDDYPQPIEGFMGIPYAFPPTGDRRFRHLEPLPKSDATIVAKAYGSICPGKAFRDGAKQPMSEDCLTANIFRPLNTTADSKLPVALHLHGGAFNRGQGHMHDTASMLAWSEKPFVGVQFNYRLGALGFLPSNVTAAEGVLNLGLHDHIFFLNWVKDNIAAFGGDPEDITLFGLSAGAHAIGHHIMDMTRKPVFKSAILESGATTARSVHPYSAKLHDQQFREYVEKAGCSGLKDSEIFKCLREQPSEKVIAASFDVFDAYNPSLRWAFQPCIDGDIIQRRPTESWKLGQYHKMPMITGFTHNEASSYVSKSMDASEEFLDFFKLLVPKLSNKDYEQLDATYPDPLKSTSSPYLDTRDIPVGSQFKRVEAAYAHYAYVCPVRATAKYASKAQKDPVYVYHWALNQTVLNGANHGDNKNYEAYEKNAREFSETQEEMARIVHAYWTSFITQGYDPNKLPGRAENRPRWLPYGSKDSKKIMLFGEGNDERAGGSGTGILAQMVEDVWSAKECDFWWSRAEQIDQ